ncbi:MAG: hypothetical protein V5A63_19540, partial [Bacteroides sp.]|uniref:hypothetical protein n=1 Tax=Bacteroides sp. TaxID=29523 RepID=UPI002FC39433
MKKKILVILTAICLITITVPASKNFLPVWDWTEEQVKENWSLRNSDDWSMINDSGAWKMRWQAGESNTGLATADDSSMERTAM